MLAFRKAKEIDRWHFSNNWALVKTEYKNKTTHYYLCAFNSSNFTNIPHDMALEMITDFELQQTDDK
jgi:hypothetical protein